MPGAGGREDGELLFNGYRVSVWEDEQLLEMDGGDGCTTILMDLMPLNHTLKNNDYNREINSMLCDDLEDRIGRVGGRLKREGIWGYMYTYS